MKKSFLLGALLALACGFASAQTFGFGTAGGSYMYCNYEQLAQFSPYDVWQGYDNLSACAGATINPSIVGTSGGLSASGNPFGFPVKGITYADEIYDAYALGFTDLQWYVVTSKKCAKFKNGRYSGKYGWVGIGVASGFVFAANYGYVSCLLPGQSGAPPTKGMTIGIVVPKRR